MPLVDHIILTVNDLERSRLAYGWLLPRLGFTERHDMGAFSGWFSATRQHGGQIWLKQADPRHASDRFDKDRVGLCELAFAVDSRDDIAALVPGLATHDFQVLHPPTEYDYVPGYYSVFILDPDGIKLDVVSRAPSPDIT